MTEPKRRKLPLAGLGLISAGGVLGVTLGVSGAAYADSTVEASTSSDSRDPSTGSDTAVSRSRSSTSPRTSAEPGQATVLLVARLDRAVAAGSLTRDQADAILAAAEAGLLNGDLVGGPGGRPGPAIDRQSTR